MRPTFATDEEWADGGPSDRPAIDFRSIADMTEPPNAGIWLTENLLRPNVLGIIAGYEGVAKSYLRLQLGLALATGNCLFLDHYAVGDPVTVGVIDEENGDVEEWRREETFIEALGRTRAEVGRYHRASFTGLVLGSRPWQAALEQAISDLLVAALPVVLFLDTVTSMHDGKEWGEELKPIVRYLRSLLKRFEALTLVLIVHVVKPRGETRELGTALSDVMGNWTKTADVVAVVAPLVNGKLRWTVHKKVPPSDVILGRDGPLWKALSDYVGKTVKGVDPVELFDFVKDKGRVQARDVMAKFGVSKKTALEAFRAHPGLDLAAIDNRGTLEAWVKDAH